MSTYINGIRVGLSYGSCYGMTIALSIPSAVQNTWYGIVSSNIDDGSLYQIAHDGGGKLTVANAGTYLITYNIGWKSSAANSHIETTLNVNGVDGVHGIAHTETRGISIESGLSGTAILTLGASATIQVSIRTTNGGTPNLSVECFNLAIAQVGI